jgi:hypothetical protein
MRLPDSAQTSRAWRINPLTPDWRTGDNTLWRVGATA